MLDDSAPKGEELPGDGDWNTGRGTDNSEDLRAMTSSHTEQNRQTGLQWGRSHIGPWQVSCGEGNENEFYVTE